MRSGFGRLGAALIGQRVGTTSHGSVFAPIPRVIHQTWKSSDIPAEWKGYQASWRRAHPDWEYHFWTDEDNRRLIADRHSWFLETYDRFPRGIQRVDAAKYFILYTHGGVYADLDCECVRPIDALVDPGGAILSRTRDGVIDCALLASPPGHRFWPLVFRELQQPALAALVLRRLPGMQASYVLFSTGTRMMKRAVRRYRAALPARRGDGITVYDARFFSSRSWLDRYRPFEETLTFVRHHYTDSWLFPNEQKVHAWFTRRVAAAGLLVLGGVVALLGVLLL